MSDLYRVGEKIRSGVAVGGFVLNGICSLESPSTYLVIKPFDAEAKVGAYMALHAATKRPPAGVRAHRVLRWLESCGFVQLMDAQQEGL